MNENKNDKIVLVTGATGYIAGHLIKQLLERGYSVKGTVRDINRKDKTEHLVKIANDLKASDRLSFIQCDLTSDNNWDIAVKGVNGIFHTASPFPAAQPDNEDEVIKPAVEGTTRVLEAASKHNNAVRIVLTSSVAAVSAGHDKKERKTPFTEEDWTKIDGDINPYTKSKALAEKKAWELARELKLDLVTINPAYVLGPILNKTGGTSYELVKRILNKQDPGVADILFHIVDVRTVAQMHIKAFEIPEAKGRYLSVDGSAKLPEIANWFKKEFEPHGYSIATWKIPYFLLWIISQCDKTVKSVLNNVGESFAYDTTKAENELGIKHYDIKQTLIEMGYSLIDFGVVEDKRNKQIKFKIQI